MTQVSRRALFCALPPLALVGVLTACASATVAKFVDDATTVANALKAAEPAIKAVSGIATTVVADATATIDAIKSYATSLSSVTGTGATAAVNAISAGYDHLKAALTGYTLPAWVTTALSDVAILMPTIKAAVGIAAMVALAPNPADVDAARARLRAVAGRP